MSGFIDVTDDDLLELQAILLGPCNSTKIVRKFHGIIVRNFHDGENRLNN